MIELPVSLSEFLAWLPTNAAFLLFIAVFLELIPGWANWNSNLKAALTLLLAIGLATLSAALVRWIPAGVPPTAEEVYSIIRNSLVLWLGSQYAHNALKQRLLKSETETKTTFKEGPEAPLG